MRVRVHDKSTNSYFVSEVYAIINSGIFEKYLVTKKIGNSSYLKFHQYIDTVGDKV